jgi:serine/threonine protein kinase
MTSKSQPTISTSSVTWILGKAIGTGASGKVKLAGKEGGTEQVAIKIVPRKAMDSDMRTAHEIAIMKLLRHPFICGIQDVVRTNSHWYILLEYINGRSVLDYVISHGQLRERQARKISRQIASALDYCHRNSIVHRDIKIENILISKTGDIKITDFWLSSLYTPGEHMNTFCGSSYFPAPELLEARPYFGPQVDVWNFGIVLYILVCGKVPFDDQNLPALREKIKRGVIKFPVRLSVDCKNILCQMLATDPKRRPSLPSIANHCWMKKGYPGPPENFLPCREPLSLPLDQDVIDTMTGLDFGSPEEINIQLTRIVESEGYRSAVHAFRTRRDCTLLVPSKDRGKKVFCINLYRSRKSRTGGAKLDTPNVETLTSCRDPFDAFHPLISLYYLAREKKWRQKQLSTVSAASLPADVRHTSVELKDI